MEKPKVETSIDATSEIRGTSQGTKQNDGTCGAILLRAIEVPIMKPESGIIMSTALALENRFGFQSVPNQYMHPRFGLETSPANFPEKSISVVGTDGSNARQKGIDEFKNDSSMVSMISYVMEDSRIGVNHATSREIEVDDAEHKLPVSMNKADTSKSMLVSTEQPCGREGGHVTLMRDSYNNGGANIRSVGSSFGQGINNAKKKSLARNKKDSNPLFSGKYEDIMDALSKPVSSYTLLYEPHLFPKSKARRRKKVDVEKGNANAVVAISRQESTYKNKSEKKATKKEVAYKFITNVRTLTGTGILDGVAVRYSSASKEKQLHGIIKGSGYLCGCQSCNYSKTLNALEFEHHAGCKTSHPNNHIQFENGKTIHQVVQELKNTPEHMILNVIQTVTGSRINQQAFSGWTNSFQAASRKLQLMSAKE